MKKRFAIDGGQMASNALVLITRGRRARSIENAPVYLRIFQIADVEMHLLLQVIFRMQFIKRIAFP